MFYLGRRSWWPILCGIGFAVVELLSFMISQRPLGAARGYTVIGSIVEYVLTPEHAKNVSYWDIYEPYIEWTIASVAGVIFGSFLSSISSGEFRIKMVPDMWRFSKGSSWVKRWVWALIGGILVGFGARMALGCTLGMLISGVIQLAPAGFIFMMSLWMGGMMTTGVFYHIKTITLKRG
ncbi:MAG: YeeE/YedE family protein [Candidatus Magnetoovum sp. WYHC-5]|nr:YeeE/YedE family protein [Candidatus Magnetoovum sp. WYHC-5]